MLAWTPGPSSLDSCVMQNTSIRLAPSECSLLVRETRDLVGFFEGCRKGFRRQKGGAV